MRTVLDSPTRTMIICECSLTEEEKVKIDRYITRILNERFKEKTEKKNGKNKH